MKRNADLTIYNKYIDSSTRSEKYQRTVIRSITWESSKAVSAMQAGRLATNSADIYIPRARGENHLDPIAWTALVSKVGKWTLAEGDFVVKGEVADEITTGFTTTNLMKKYDNVLVITSVDLMDRGSANIQHWQVGAK